MALQARNALLSRRIAGIEDLSMISLSDGDITVDNAETEGVMRINCSHQIGIATQTEVGLTAARFPIRVVIVDPKMNYTAHSSQTVCRYWPVKHADGTAVPYSRKPNVNPAIIEHLYACTADLDTMLWSNYRAVKMSGGKGGIVPAWEQTVASLYALTSVVSPNAEQYSQMGELVNTILTEAIVQNSYAYFQVGDNAYMFAVPHGRNFTDLHGMSAQKVANTEALLTVKINNDRLRSRYETLADGVVTIASVAIMCMFRHGIAETYESQEFHTVEVSRVEDKVYTIENIYSPATAGVIEGVKVGDLIDIKGIGVSKKTIEIGNMLVMSAGLMHYLFNHTTGGMQASGTLLTTMAMFKFITPATSFEEHTHITSMMYEALHPVNKRAVANIFFEKSKVVTHGRSSAFRKYEQFTADTYFAIRCNPFPAGSHKAFICITALRRVLQAGLGPFLPWADQMNSCINICKDVLTSGARAHIGSFYYTGDPPVVQPSSLDQYLPELATFLHTFHKGDSLTLSPHMSIENANRASMNWQNLLKDLKAKDVSSTPTELVRSYLATTGAVNFSFDPNDASTWAKAALDSSDAQKVITSVFN